MSVKEIQRSLGVTADGIWSNQSQSALENSHKWLNLSFDKLRSYFGCLTSSQVQGFNNTLAVINTFVDAKGKKAAKNPLYLAYMLATKWHETARTMQPIEEYGKGKGRPYGTWLTNSKGVKYCQAVGGKKPYFYTFADYPHLYYGRGDVQLTWLDNYIKMTKKINAYIDRNPACGLAHVDLANNPAQACDPTIAALAMVIGMLDGDFTGLSLSKCITSGSRADFVKARRIINGTNEDDRIADYAVKFLDCIILSEPPTLAN